MKNLLMILVFLLYCFSLVRAQTNLHPQGDSVLLNGKYIWYEKEGKGDALFLIAGGPGFSHSYFHPFFSALADSFQIIYLDAYGTGKSGRDEKEKNYSMAYDVEIIEALRKALNIGKIYLAGHSYGGFVAQLYAIKYSNHLKGLILCNTLASGGDMQLALNAMNREIKYQYPEQWQRILKVRKQGYKSSSRLHQETYNVPGTLYNFYNAENASKILHTESNFFNPNLWYAIAGEDADFIISKEMMRFNVKAALKNISIPVLVIAGRFDRCVRPEFTEQYKKLVPNASFVMMEKSGHFPFIEEKDKTMDVIRKFMSR